MVFKVIRNMNPLGGFLFSKDTAACYPRIKHTKNIKKLRKEARPQKERPNLSMMIFRGYTWKILANKLLYWDFQHTGQPIHHL